MADVQAFIYGSTFPVEIGFEIVEVTMQSALTELDLDFEEKHIDYLFRVIRKCVAITKPADWNENDTSSEALQAWGSRAGAIFQAYLDRPCDETNPLTPAFIGVSPAGS